MWPIIPVFNMSCFGVCRNFFELVRFDFVVNQDYRIFLMEVQAMVLSCTDRITCARSSFAHCCLSLSFLSNATRFCSFLKHKEQNRCKRSPLGRSIWCVNFHCKISMQSCSRRLNVISSEKMMRISCYRGCSFALVTVAR